MSGSGDFLQGLSAICSTSLNFKEISVAVCVGVCARERVRACVWRPARSQLCTFGPVCIFLKVKFTQPKIVLQWTIQWH